MKLTVSLFLQSSNSPAELFCCTVEVVTLCGGCCCQKTNEGGNDFVAEPMRSLRGRDWRGGRMKVPGPINHECSSSMLTLPSSSECEGKRRLGMTVRLEKELTISQGRTEDEELTKGGWQKKGYLGGKRRSWRWIWLDKRVSAKGRKVRLGIGALDRLASKTPAS
jgi:hypothetical protein